MQPCRAPQSQSLLLGVELELQQMIAECLSSTVGLDGCEIWSRGEESCIATPVCSFPGSIAGAAAISSVRQPHQRREGTAPSLTACVLLVAWICVD